MSTPEVPPPLQSRASDRPPREERWGAGATMSLVAHAALVAGLAWSVRWHTDANEGVEAELWSAVPQAAAPAPTAIQPPPAPTPAPPPPAPVPSPPPPPPAPAAAPRPPDIVTQRDEQAKLREKEKQRQEDERKKQDQLKQQKLDQQKAADEKKLAEQQKKLDQQKAAELKKQDEQKLARARADQLARIAAMAGGQAVDDKANGKAAKSSGPSAGYEGRIRARIRPNIRPVREFDAALATEIELHLGPDGSILGRRITRSSGDPAWDDEALKAVDRTGVLPRDVDGTVPRSIIVTIKPES